MSELVRENSNNHGLRWHLLGTTSAAVFIALAPVAALADDTDRPIVWIDLGGQLERVDSEQHIFAPAFFDNSPAAILAPMVDAQKPSHFSIGGEGKLTFIPQGSSWVFSASALYGRSNAARHEHYQTAHPYLGTIFGHPAINTGRPVEMFGDGQMSSNDSHFIADFMAGKDIGLGLFGTHGHSVISAGVRFAQFTSNTQLDLNARPRYRTGPILNRPGYHHWVGNYYRNYTALFQSRRSAHAVGPAVSWDASLPVAQNSSAMEATFDWGVNAAILFGRQRARVHHQTSGGYFHEYPGSNYPYVINSYAKPPADQTRARSVTIPNVGGFAGVSFRYSNAKIKFGYRGDFFFGAMDTGIDTAKKTDVGFYGPFATISIGLGG